MLPYWLHSNEEKSRKVSRFEDELQMIKIIHISAITTISVDKLKRKNYVKNISQT